MSIAICWKPHCDTKGCSLLFLKIMLARNFAPCHLAPPCVFCITAWRPEQKAASKRLFCGGKWNGSDVLWAGLLMQELQKEPRKLNGTILTWAGLLGRCPALKRLPGS